MVDINEIVEGTGRTVCLLLSFPFLSSGLSIKYMHETRMDETRINSKVQIFPIKPPPRSTMVFAWAVVAGLIGLMIYFMKMIEGMGW